ncbi:hypothetical protein KM043_000006, partial [Ampulex compressa]
LTQGRVRWGLPYPGGPVRWGLPYPGGPVRWGLPYPGPGQVGFALPRAGSGGVCPTRGRV